MIACSVYLLCTLTSALCAALLYRRYIAVSAPLLFWSTWCFVCLTITNVLLFIDLIVVPQTSLSVIRSTITLAGMLMLLQGLTQEKH